MKTENNVLIAQFMDGVLIHNGKMVAFPDIRIEGGGLISNNRALSDLHYHSSWQWLMPVVEKIEITSVDGEDNSDEFFNVVIEVFECNINGSGRTVCGVGQNKIEATYKAVVEFIKWYNNQNK